MVVRGHERNSQNAPSSDDAGVLYHWANILNLLRSRYTRDKTPTNDALLLAWMI